MTNSRDTTGESMAASLQSLQLAQNIDETLDNVGLTLEKVQLQAPQLEGDHAEDINVYVRAARAAVAMVLFTLRHNDAEYATVFTTRDLIPALNVAFSLASNFFPTHSMTQSLETARNNARALFGRGEAQIPQQYEQ